MAEVGSEVEAALERLDSTEEAKLLKDQAVILKNHIVLYTLNELRALYTFEYLRVLPEELGNLPENE